MGEVIFPMAKREIIPAEELKKQIDIFSGLDGWILHDKSFYKARVEHRGKMKDFYRSGLTFRTAQLVSMDSFKAIRNQLIVTVKSDTPQGKLTINGYMHQFITGDYGTELSLYVCNVNFPSLWRKIDLGSDKRYKLTIDVEQQNRGLKVSRRKLQFESEYSTVPEHLIQYFIELIPIDAIYLGRPTSSQASGGFKVPYPPGLHHSSASRKSVLAIKTGNGVTIKKENKSSSNLSIKKPTKNEDTSIKDETNLDYDFRPYYGTAIENEMNELCFPSTFVRKYDDLSFMSEGSSKIKLAYKPARVMPKTTPKLEQLTVSGKTPRKIIKTRKEVIDQFADIYDPKPLEDCLNRINPKITSKPDKPIQPTRDLPKPIIPEISKHQPNSQVTIKSDCYKLPEKSTEEPIAAIKIVLKTVEISKPVEKEVHIKDESKKPHRSFQDGLPWHNTANRKPQHPISPEKDWKYGSNKPELSFDRPSTSGFQNGWPYNPNQFHHKFGSPEFSHNPSYGTPYKKQQKRIEDRVGFPTIVSFAERRQERNRLENGQSGDTTPLALDSGGNFLKRTLHEVKTEIFETCYSAPKPQKHRPESKKSRSRDLSDEDIKPDVRNLRISSNREMGMKRPKIDSGGSEASHSSSSTVTPGRASAREAEKCEEFNKLVESTSNRVSKMLKDKTLKQILEKFLDEEKFSVYSSYQTLNVMFESKIFKMFHATMMSMDCYYTPERKTSNPEMLIDDISAWTTLQFISHVSEMIEVFAPFEEVVSAMQNQTLIDHLQKFFTILKAKNAEMLKRKKLMKEKRRLQESQRQHKKRHESKSFGNSSSHGNKYQ